MKKLISASLLAFACVSANAGIIFSDNFDSEAGANGISQLNYNSFTNWTVGNGTVDVVANTNGWGIRCAGNSGKCVDLDGSTGNAGELTSNAFNLAAGNYVLTFDISGNQRNSSSDSMLLTLGGYINDTISLNATAPWQTVSYAFNVNSASSNNISFNHNGGDNIGIMLDNVTLTSSVDEPATIALLSLGLLGLGAARRKQK